MSQIAHSTISTAAKYEEILDILEIAYGIRLNNCMNVVLGKKRPAILPYSRNKRIPLGLLEKIKTYKGPMFITDRTIENAQENIQFGSFVAYFNLENEKDNPIILLEKKWLIEEEGFDLNQAYYFAFSYFISGKLNGIFFLFAKNKEEAEQIERQQAVIAKIITTKML